MDKELLHSCDPHKLQELVHKEVEINTVNQGVHKGIVYTVDPVSRGFVLVNFEGDNAAVKINVIMGHAIEKVSITDRDVTEFEERVSNLFIARENLEKSNEDIKERKDKLKSWLLKNRIPVSEDNEESDFLNIMDTLQIFPPYSEESCISTNKIVLEKVQNIIRCMPK